MRAPSDLAKKKFSQTQIEFLNRRGFSRVNWDEVDSVIKTFETASDPYVTASGLLRPNLFPSISLVVSVLMLVDYETRLKLIKDRPTLINYLNKSTQEEQNTWLKWLSDNNAEEILHLPENLSSKTRLKLLAKLPKFICFNFWPPLTDQEIFIAISTSPDCISQCASTFDKKWIALCYILGDDDVKQFYENNWPNLINQAREAWEPYWTHIVGNKK